MFCGSWRNFLGSKVVSFYLLAHWTVFGGSPLFRENIRPFGPPEIEHREKIEKLVHNMLRNDPWNVCASFQDRTRWNGVKFFEFVRLRLPCHAETANYLISVQKWRLYACLPWRENGQLKLQLIDLCHKMLWGPSLGYSAATARFWKTRKKHRSASFPGSQKGDYFVKQLGCHRTTEKRYKKWRRKTHRGSKLAKWPMAHLCKVSGCNSWWAWNVQFLTRALIRFSMEWSSSGELHVKARKTV